MKILLFFSLEFESWYYREVLPWPFPVGQSWKLECLHFNEFRGLGSCKKRKITFKNTSPPLVNMSGHVFRCRALTWTGLFSPHSGASPAELFLGSSLCFMMQGHVDFAWGLLQCMEQICKSPQPLLPSLPLLQCSPAGKPRVTCLCVCVYKYIQVCI